MNDRHERFIAWLESGAVQPLARDVAVHAWVCPICMGQVAALDSLRTIDLDRAPMPSWQPVALRGTGGMRSAGQFAATAIGVTATMSLLAFGAGQLIADRLETTGQVLAAHGTPEPSASPSSTATASATPSPSATPSASPIPSPAAAVAPAIVVTPRPTVRATRQPTPRPTPVATAAPTVSPTPSASLSATPSPTPSASAPSPSASPS